MEVHDARCTAVGRYMTSVNVDKCAVVDGCLSGCQSVIQSAGDEAEHRVTSVCGRYEQT